MVINFYKCNDDPRTLNKQLTDMISYDCEIYDACSIQNPQIIIEYSNALVDYNYFYIPDWQRYYFLNTMVTDSGGKLIINMTIDVLMSHKENIKLCNAYCARNEGIGGPTYVVDKQLPVIQGRYEIKSAYLSGDPLVYSESRYVLTTLGGGK